MFFHRSVFAFKNYPDCLRTLVLSRFFLKPDLKKSKAIKSIKLVSEISYIKVADNKETDIIFQLIADSNDIKDADNSDPDNSDKVIKNCGN